MGISLDRLIAYLSNAFRRGESLDFRALIERDFEDLKHLPHLASVPCLADQAAREQSSNPSRFASEMLSNALDALVGVESLPEFRAPVRIRCADGFFSITDDGKGMSAETLLKVFLIPGQTDKTVGDRLSSVDGRFGRGAYQGIGLAGRVTVTTCDGVESHQLSIERSEAGELLVSGKALPLEAEPADGFDQRGTRIIVQSDSLKGSSVLAEIQAYLAYLDPKQGRQIIFNGKPMQQPRLVDLQKLTTSISGSDAAVAQLCRYEAHHPTPNEVAITVGGRVVMKQVDSRLRESHVLCLPSSVEISDASRLKLNLTPFVEEALSKMIVALPTLQAVNALAPMVAALVPKDKTASPDSLLSQLKAQARHRAPKQIPDLQEYSRLRVPGAQFVHPLLIREDWMSDIASRTHHPRVLSVAGIEGGFAVLIQGIVWVDQTHYKALEAMGMLTGLDHLLEDLFRTVQKENVAGTSAALSVESLPQEEASAGAGRATQTTPLTTTNGATMPSEAMSEEALPGGLVKYSGHHGDLDFPRLGWVGALSVGPQSLPLPRFEKARHNLPAFKRLVYQVNPKLYLEGYFMLSLSTPDGRFFDDIVQFDSAREVNWPIGSDVPKKLVMIEQLNGCRRTLIWTGRKTLVLSLGSELAYVDGFKLGEVLVFVGSLRGEDQVHLSFVSLATGQFQKMRPTAKGGLILVDCDRSLSDCFNEAEDTYDASKILEQGVSATGIRGTELLFQIESAELLSQAVVQLSEAEGEIVITDLSASSSVETTLPFSIASGACELQLKGTSFSTDSAHMCLYGPYVLVVNELEPDLRRAVSVFCYDAELDSCQFVCDWSKAHFEMFWTCSWERAENPFDYHYWMEMFQQFRGEESHIVHHSASAVGRDLYFNLMNNAAAKTHFFRVMPKAIYEREAVQNFLSMLHVCCLSITPSGTAIIQEALFRIGLLYADRIAHWANEPAFFKRRLSYLFALHKAEPLGLLPNADLDFIAGLTKPLKSTRPDPLVYAELLRMVDSPDTGLLSKIMTLTDAEVAVVYTVLVDYDFSNFIRALHNPYAFSQDVKRLWEASVNEVPLPLKSAPDLYAYLMSPHVLKLKKRREYGAVDGATVLPEISLPLFLADSEAYLQGRPITDGTLEYGERLLVTEAFQRPDHAFIQGLLLKQQASDSLTLTVSRDEAATAFADYVLRGEIWSISDLPKLFNPADPSNLLAVFKHVSALRVTLNEVTGREMVLEIRQDDVGAFSIQGHQAEGQSRPKQNTLKLSLCLADTNAVFEQLSIFQHFSQGVRSKQLKLALNSQWVHARTHCLSGDEARGCIAVYEAKQPFVSVDGVFVRSLAVQDPLMSALPNLVKEALIQNDCQIDLPTSGFELILSGADFQLGWEGALERHRFKTICLEAALQLWRTHKSTAGFPLDLLDPRTNHACLDSISLEAEAVSTGFEVLAYLSSQAIDDHGRSLRDLRSLEPTVKIEIDPSWPEQVKQMVYYRNALLGAVSIEPKIFAEGLMPREDSQAWHLGLELSKALLLSLEALPAVTLGFVSGKLYAEASTIHEKICLSVDNAIMKSCVLALCKTAQKGDYLGFTEAFSYLVSVLSHELVHTREYLLPERSHETTHTTAFYLETVSDYLAAVVRVEPATYFEQAQKIVNTRATLALVFHGRDDESPVSDCVSGESMSEERGAHA